MRQQTLAVAAEGSFEKYRNPTRREVFLAEMDRIVPWPQMVALVEPRYPQAGNGRRPVGAEWRPKTPSSYANTSAGDTSCPPTPAPINQFYTGFLNPYVNYHRPSAQAEIQIDPRGANAASTSSGARRWKRCSRSIVRNNTCAPDSVSTRSSAWPHPSATPRPRDACNRQKTPCSSR